MPLNPFFRSDHANQGIKQRLNKLCDQRRTEHHEPCGSEIFLRAVHLRLGLCNYIPMWHRSGGPSSGSTTTITPRSCSRVYKFAIYIFLYTRLSTVYCVCVLRVCVCVLLNPIFTPLWIRSPQTQTHLFHDPFGW